MPPLAPPLTRIQPSRVRVRLLVLLGAGLWLACGGAPEGPRPDVLLVTVDTLRADFVHCYGFGPDTTPGIDALAARGVLFEDAISASTATVPSHASIMTSRYVREHSVGAWNGATRLEGAPTLAEAFRRAGYATAAFVSNVVLKARSGLDAGFDLYDDDLPAAERNRGLYFERVADQTVPRALTWLGARGEAPFFLWVHLQDPHGPYTPPEPWAHRVPEVPMRSKIDLPVMRTNRGRGGVPAYQALPGVHKASRYAGLYAGEIAFADHWLGKLLDAARQASAGRGLVVVVTADHGESLDEDGFFFQHGHSTTPEQTHVPLVIAAPGIAPRRVAGVVSHVDLAPTLLELAGLPPLPRSSGISLVPALRGAALPDRTVVSDIGHEVGAYDARGYFTVKVIRKDANVFPPPDPERALREQRLDWQRFDRIAPGEEPDAFRKHPGLPLPQEVTGYLAHEVPVVPAPAPDEADVERLRALGYLPPAD